MQRNHTTITGPNRVATLAVPRAWATNSRTKTATEDSSTVELFTTPCSWGTVFMPSMAESTEMAGVITASP